VCGGVVQTRDIIEEMAAADQKQKGWHSTRSVMARRRFLQVPLPYCMETKQHSHQCIGRRHHTIVVSCTAQDCGNGTSGPGCGGSVQTSAWLLLQEASGDGGGDSSAPKDSSDTAEAAKGSSSDNGTSQGGSGSGSGGSSNGSESANPMANNAGEGAAQGGELPGGGAAAPTPASKESQPEKVSPHFLFLLSAKCC
jgi:hypothetical protein